MMMTDRIQPSPLPGDIGRGQWFLKHGLNTSRGPDRIVLNVQGHSFKRHGEMPAGLTGPGTSATLDRTKKNKNSNLEPPFVIRSSNRLSASDIKSIDLPDSRNTSSLGRYTDSGTLTRDGVNLTMSRRPQGNHQSVSRFDGSPNTDVRKFPGSMYRAGSSNSIMQPSLSLAARNRHDADHKHTGDSRALETARRIYAQNLSAQHDAGFQSDDNIWTARLSTYPNSTINKYGRRVASHGVKIELDTVGVDYRIARPSRPRVDSADGLLEDSSSRRAGGDTRAESLDDEDRLMPLYGAGNQSDNHLSTRMKGSKSYRSLPDCRPHGGSILKKSNGVYSDGGGGTYSRHCNTLTVPGRARKGSYRSSQSRRVLFNNDVDVYRFDSEDSACSSSECERLNNEPIDRRRLVTRHRPSGGAFVKGKQMNGGMGARSQSLDDVTAPETSSRRWWLPGKKKDSLQKNKVISASKQLEGLALESKPKRTASVGDLTERDEGHFDISNIKPLAASVYYNPRSNQVISSSNSKLSTVERISTPGPAKSEAGRYKNLLPIISNSISDPQPEEPRLRKVAVTASAATNTSASIPSETASKLSLHKMLSSTQFVPSTDTTDGFSNQTTVEMRTSTPGPGDLSQHRSSTASNRSSIEGPILSRMHNLTAASSMASNAPTRKPPSTSNHLIYNNQPINALRLSESSYSSSGYNSDTLSWASKTDIYSDRSKDNLSKKSSPPLFLQTAPLGSQNKSLQDKSNQSVLMRIPEKQFAEKSKNPKMVPSPAGVNFQLVTESGSSKKRLVTTVELADLRLTPKDIRVKSNKSGNVMHVIAAGVDDCGSVDQRLSLPVHVDPYKITAKLDSSRQLIIEAPVVE